MRRLDLPALLHHAPRLLEVQRAAYAVEAALIDDDRIPQLTESLEELVAQDLTWHVAQVDDEVVAAIAHRWSGEVLEIDRLVVDPRWHRRGLARRLLAALPEGPTTVSTGRDNTPARALYERLGFRHTGDREVLAGLWVSSYSRQVGRLRVGVIGTAHWARETHAAGAVTAARADLAAVWGRTPERTRAFAERYDVTAAGSVEELLEQVDVVTFAVPPQAQAALAVVAARAGKHLLLEKPVATTQRTAEEVRNALREGGGCATVFFTRRYVPELERRVREAAEESWASARVVWQANSFEPDSPYRESVWRADPLAALWDLTPHVLSQLIPVLGSVEEVSAVRAGHGVDLRTLHASGAHADISVSLQAPAYVDTCQLLRADGSEHSLDSPEVDAVDAFARALDGLVCAAQGVATDHPPLFDLGVEVTRVLAEAEASLQM